MQGGGASFTQPDSPERRIIGILLTICKNNNMMLQVLLLVVSYQHVSQFSLGCIITLPSLT